MLSLSLKALLPSFHTNTVQGRPRLAYCWYVYVSVMVKSVYLEAMEHSSYFLPSSAHGHVEPVLNLLSVLSVVASLS